MISHQSGGSLCLVLILTTLLQIEDILVADRQLAKELLYDIKQDEIARRVLPGSQAVLPAAAQLDVRQEHAPAQYPAERPAQQPMEIDGDASTSTRVESLVARREDRTSRNASARPPDTPIGQTPVNGSRSKRRLSRLGKLDCLHLNS